mgnify:CR=1 FL=1
MRAIPIILSLLLLCGSFLVAPISQAAGPAQPVVIYFFWGDGCPHCEEAWPFLRDLAKRYPQIQLESYEIYTSTENQQLFEAMAAAHGFEPRVVPTIFIGEEHWEGFAGAMGTSIERGVNDCLAKGCPDAGASVVPGRTAPSPTTTTEPIPTAPAPEVTPVAEGVTVYLFWGNTCPTCEVSETHHATLSGLPQIGEDPGPEAYAFLDHLADEIPGLTIQAYDVWTSDRDRATFDRVAAAYDTRPRGVPTIFVGGAHWEGFDAATAAEIRATVEACRVSGCLDPVTAQPVPEVPETPQPEVAAVILTLPLLGTVDLGDQSLWVSTALISLVDGFNPCSLWVLSILIALSLRTGSRKRTLTIGLVYITVTAAVYVLFIGGLFTVLTVASFLSWLPMVISGLTLLFALVNIKDYFWYKEGLSLTIADDQKPGIFKRMRAVVQAGDSFWALAATTVALAAGVSLVEFACTSGFPVVWTNLVASQSVSTPTFVLLLALYMLIYQLDELAIFGTAVFTLKVTRIEERHGRLLKLISGMLMLTLSVVMLVDPALMNDLGSSLLVFGIALGAALAVLLIHRAILAGLARRRA